MRYNMLADLIVLLHAMFVLFVVCGGLAVLRWPGLVWLHLPAAAWGVGIELSGKLCPLTYLENYWRRLGGAAGYSGTFIQKYLEPILYPLGLEMQSQMLLGIVVLLVNLAVYVRFWIRRRGGHGRI